MVWLVALFCILLVGALVRVFVLSARAIRRDMDERFKHVQAELEQEANSVVKNLLNRREGT